MCALSDKEPFSGREGGGASLTSELSVRAGPDPDRSVTAIFIFDFSLTCRPALTTLR